MFYLACAFGISLKNYQALYFAVFFLHNCTQCSVLDRCDHVTGLCMSK